MRSYESYHGKPMKLLTIGTFDTPHIGHAAFLRKCSMVSDEVIVGVNSDEFVKEYRGQSPVYSLQERLDLIGLLGYQTWVNDGAGRETIIAVAPDILAIGSDWARKDYYKQIGITQDELDTLDIMLMYIPYTKGISSTDIKGRLA